MITQKKNRTMGIIASRMTFSKVMIRLIFMLVVACNPAKPEKNLEANFINPPNTAKPKTWMHAMSGNMSKAGLTKDLEAISDAGLGGLLLFNIAQGIPYGKIDYNSDEHHEMIQHAAKECERLGLSFGVHNCDGWSSSGGPWITPEQSMKMVVWSETVVDGEEVDLKLKQPTTREGFYRDIAVLAYPALPSEIEESAVQPIVSASDQDYDITLAVDFRIDEGSKIEKKDDTEPWIQFDYGQSFTVRSSYVVCSDRNGDIFLQTSDNGKDYKDVKKLEKGRTGKGEWVHYDQYAPVKSRFFRLRMTQSMNLKEARLSATTTIFDGFGRISMARTEDAELKPIGNPEPYMIIKKESIIDLSDHMDTNGILKTKLPKGKWTIMRFGYTSTSAFNHPASNIGRGLECDKFSREAFKIHYDAFVSKVIQNTKNLAPNAMQYVEIDSYEMGGQNWTKGYAQIFNDRKSYDIKEFLPLYAGRFVENVEVSEQVMVDIRQVNCDLMAENYFGYFTELCHNDDVKSYVEPYGFGPLNDLDVGAKSDINMGEFWMNRSINMVQSAVSASHIYGKPVVSAESFTTSPGINWKGHPGMAKTSGDLAWCYGINEFMFHRFAHQANTHVKPGMTMNRWGFHFDRTQTWWNNAGKDWFKYIARGSYMLRQGNPVADLLVFVGDGAPNSVFKRNDFDPAIPAGTKFDNTNADVLINRIRLKNGKMNLPEGVEYKMLVLQNCDKLSLKTLKRILEISQAGVAVVGEKPSEILGYQKSEEDKQLFQQLVDEIWSAANTYTQFDWSAIFKKENIKPDLLLTGRDEYEFIHRKMDDADIYFFFNPDTIAQQFECSFRVSGKIPELWDAMTGETAKIGSFIEQDGNTKVWINLEREQSAFVVFRESSKGVKSVVNSYEKPLLLDYKMNQENQMMLTVSKNGIFETVFSNGKSITTNIEAIPEPVELKGDWIVNFRKEDDYEASHTFNKLIDWKDHPNSGVKYYSGTAVYRKTYEVDKDFIESDNRYFLDLGEVNIVAEVRLNGNAVGIDWMQPFQLDITEQLKAGENHLAIEITNQWSNRLIGDERFPKQDGGYRYAGSMPKDESKIPAWYANNQPMPAGPRTTFCTGQFYKKGDKLMPSGLIGPVKIITKKEIVIN